MGSRRRKRRRPLIPLRLVITNAGWGAIGGGVIAGVALAVGAARVVVALLFGQTMEAVSWSDARLLVVYVVSFVMAGLLVGVLRTFLPGKPGTFASMAAGGVFVMCTIVAADKGVAAMTRVDWIAMTIMGVIFGCAGAYGWVRAQ
jgi:hypothetical protein